MPSRILVLLHDVLRRRHHRLRLRRRPLLLRLPDALLDLARLEGLGGDLRRLQLVLLGDLGRLLLPLEDLVALLVPIFPALGELLRRLEVVGRGVRGLGRRRDRLALRFVVLDRPAGRPRRVPRGALDLALRLEVLAVHGRQAAGVVGVGVGLVGDDADRSRDAVPDRPRAVRVAERAGRIAVLLADLGDAVELQAAAVEAGPVRLRLAVPVAVRRHDREVLLARVLDRIVGAGRRHAGVDAVFLAAVVAADPGQALARRRRAARASARRAC